MANVISAEVLSSIHNGVRASVNHQYFVEAEVMTSVAGGVDAKILSGVGTAIVVVDSWYPTDNTFNVPHMHPYLVNCHAHADSNEFEQLYDDGTDGDLWSTGTAVDVTPTLDGIQLAVDAPSPDFSTYEDDVALTDALQPENWTYLGHAYEWYADAPNDRAYSNAYTDHSHVRYDDGGEPDSGELLARFWVNSSTDYVGFNMWTRGAGSALRGYQVVMQCSGAYTSMRRMYDDDSTYGGGGTITFGTPTANNWYWLKIKFQKNGSTSKQWWGKRWLDGDSEPASYTYGGLDTWDAGSSGYVGLTCIKGNTLVSDFQVIPAPAVYASSGTWESPSIDTTPIDKYSYGLVEWDETLPTDTTIAVEARWRNGGTWLACTNGAQVPGIGAGEHTDAGASKDSLQLRVELDTTDTDVTPLVENLRFYHEPLAPGGLGLNIDNVHTCTKAAGTLEVWGKQQVIGGVNDEAWDDIWLTNLEPYHLHNLAHAQAIQLLYNGLMIDEIVSNTDTGYWRTTGPDVEAYFSMNPIKYASAPVEARYNVQEPWCPMGHVYEWVLIDYSLGMHADAKYLVGHYQLDDHPASYLAGALELFDYPASYLAEGYLTNDHLAQFLAQGWQRSDQPAFYMPGVWTTYDQPCSYVVAVRQISDNPAMFLVRGVNREGVIEVSILDADAWAELTSRGYTRG